jgi:hypothetical protein
MGATGDRRLRVIKVPYNHRGPALSPSREGARVPFRSERCGPANDGGFSLPTPMRTQRSFVPQGGPPIPPNDRPCRTPIQCVAGDRRRPSDFSRRSLLFFLTPAKARNHTAGRRWLAPVHAAPRRDGRTPGLGVNDIAGRLPGSVGLLHEGDRLDCMLKILIG